MTGRLMSQLVRFTTETGSVTVEVADDDVEFELVTKDGLVAEARRSFQAALTEVRDAAVASLAVFRSGAAHVRPDQVEIEFGVKLNAETGAVIAKSAVEGHLNVKLTWKNDQAAMSPEAPEE